MRNIFARQSQQHVHLRRPPQVNEVIIDAITKNAVPVSVGVTLLWRHPEVEGLIGDDELVYHMNQLTIAAGRMVIGCMGDDEIHSLACVDAIADRLRDLSSDYGVHIEALTRRGY